MIKLPFWDYSRPSIRGEDPSIAWAKVGLVERAFRCGEHVTSYTMNGDLKLGVELDEMIDKLKAMGFRHLLQRLISPNWGDNENLMIRDDSAVWLDYTQKTRSINGVFHTVDQELVEPLRALMKAHITRKKTRGKVYVLVQQHGALVLKEFGVAGETFIADNYRPEVVREYHHIISDLKNGDPCGRIVILDGEPGTGKTHMVRAMFNEISDATFILVQSNFIASLGSPELLPVLMGNRRKGHPLVLVLEDADEALSSRKADNISAISALLNFSDGIFGALLDMRIVATTNIKLGDLDRAVMRPGRLCRRIEVTKLDHVQAQVVYARLTGLDGPFTEGNFYSLGEIYTAAKGGGGYVEVQPAKGRIGFLPGTKKILEETPASALGVKSGEILYTDSGERVLVRDDDQLEIDDDSDLIDEDPEESPEDDWSDDWDDDTTVSSKKT